MMKDGIYKCGSSVYYVEKGKMFDAKGVFVFPDLEKDYEFLGTVAECSARVGYIQVEKFDRVMKLLDDSLEREQRLLNVIDDLTLCVQQKPQQTLNKKSWWNRIFG